MNPRLARFLVRLYPRPWSERYGEEFRTFLETGRGGFRASANVVWSALSERTIPTVPSADPRAVPFHSWCTRAPWAVFALGPVFLLVGAYLVALVLLWSGWKIFLPEADTPFIGPVYGFANMFFQADRFFYFSAPVLIGWTTGLVAARQKIGALWPSIGLVLITLTGIMIHVRAGRTAVPHGLGHISMGFAFSPSSPDIGDRLLHASVILSLTALPYLIWRLRQNPSLLS